MSTKVITSTPCRLSYPALFRPKESSNGGEPKYSATILIPKTDVATLQTVSSAIQKEIQEASSPNGYWKGAAPANPTVTLYDGDAPNPRSGEPWGDECKGHYVLRTSSSNQPDVIDEFGQKAMDATKFYAGCYCYFSVNFAPYNNNGNKGIGAFLNCVMFAHDGDPLEARASAKDDFAAILAARGTQNLNAAAGFAVPGMPTAAAPQFGAPAMPQPSAPAMPAMPQPGVPAAPSGFGVPASPAAPQFGVPAAGFPVPNLPL